VSELIAHRYDRCALVNGDVFFGFVARGYIDPWLPEGHEQNEVVTQASSAATGAFAKGGYFTVFDGMVEPWFLPTFLEDCGVESVHYVVLLPDVETCVARVTQRTDHGFRDEAATRRMHESFAESAVDARNVVSGTAEADDVAAQVLERLDAGALVYPQAGVGR
jgi:hypothetical protein